jgi:polar amino acid transport system substrate-binding protein
VWEKTRVQEYMGNEDFHLRTKTGDFVPVSINLGVIGHGSDRHILAICPDMSERQRLQDQLIQSEKMAAIGQLAAGMAHEIRNPLAIIANALYDLSELIDADNPEVREDLEIAREEMARVQAIINNLLEFSRGSTTEMEEVDINELLHKTLQLMNKYLQDNDVTVVTEFGDIGPCIANPNALRQIFINLMTNAVQAMPEGGELRVRTARRSDRRLMLEFSDTGVGIPQEHLKDIFNPFFTTKEPGQGTGLGLSVVHSVVKRYKGDISVHSQVNGGTTFTIELPCQCSTEMREEEEAF